MIIQMPGKQKDNGMIVSGKIPGGMIGPGTLQKSPIQPRAKERKVRKGKRKGKYRNDGKHGKSGSKHEAAQTSRCCPEQYNDDYCHNLLR